MNVYDYFFEIKNFVSDKGKVFTAGDKIAYHSKSRNIVFNDAKIVKCYDNGCTIHYGKEETFSNSYWGGLGNTKYIPRKNFDKVVLERNKSIMKK